ncbi:MAG: magnesium transporter [Bauldia sp.]|nr:magnesium transporter [Bauldia sp.]
MAEETPTGDPGTIDERPIRDDRGALSEAFVTEILEAIRAGDGPAIGRLTEDLHEADFADLIRALEPDLRPIFIGLLGKDFDFAVLTELDETERVQILEELSPETVAEGVSELESDDAVYILEDLEKAEQDEILSKLPAPEQLVLKRGLEYPEESAGRRMQTEFIAVPPFWTVGQAIDHMREADDLPDDFYEIFVVDPAYRPVGTVALNRLLRAKRPTPIADIIDEDLEIVRATQDQEEVARLFERYNLVSAPVVDEAERLVGVITVDDIIDVIEEEADEDIRRLAGVGDEETSDTSFYVARSRIPWLLVNAATAFLSAAVIGLFDATIEQMVALAVLMPIVASMGGNAGIQAMTVAVRALAARETARPLGRSVLRELVVGLVNGGAIALLVGLVAGFWFADPSLGAVIGIALVGNILTASLFGALIPVALDRLRIDPAVASGVFLTTITDVVGFFLFLGLAAVWFGLW